MTRRRAVVAALALLSLGPAAPAWAHEEITPSSVPTARPVFLTLSAANERQADLNRVTVAAPRGAAFGHATREPPGWTVNRSPDTVTWSGGAVRPDHFEQWGFEIEAVDQPGTLTYRVTLGFADGRSHQSDVVVTALAPGAPPPTAPPVATSAVPPGTDPAPPPGAGGGSEQEDGGSSGSGVALALSAVALVVSLVALVLAARRRSNSAAPEEGQDW